nr:hypothetical protein [Tanacetum cinerariifolium]
MMLLEHQDIIVKFYDPSHWKELSKESCSKIFPCGDGSCWEAFKTIASLIAKGELKLTQARSFPIFTIKVKKITATALRFNRDTIVKENILDNGLETVTPSLAAENIILRNVGVEEGKTLEEAYYTHFSAPYQPREQYRAARTGFYQQNNGNYSYPDQRPSLEESLSKFMAESAKRHKENSNIIKEIQASTDAAIRNQGASIKTKQIIQMSKVLQERGFGSLPSSTETNLSDQVKSISTTKADFSEIRHIGCGLYAVSGTQHMSIIFKTVPFLKRLQNFGCDDWREA